jgi:hypothetical protein
VYGWIFHIILLVFWLDSRSLSFDDGDTYGLKKNVKFMILSTVVFASGLIYRTPPACVALVARVSTKVFVVDLIDSKLCIEPRSTAQATVSIQ